MELRHGLFDVAQGRESWRVLLNVVTNLLHP